MTRGPLELWRHTDAINAGLRVIWRETVQEVASQDATKTPNKSQRPPIKCYNCGKQGHVSMHCPEKVSYMYFCMDGQRWSVARTGSMEGIRVTDILLDTGCSRTMVRSNLVPAPRLLPGEAVDCQVCPWGYCSAPLGRGGG